MISPGGSTYPYYYKGGEIHSLKYGSFRGRQEDLFSVMDTEEEFILHRSGKLRIWVDFYDSQLTDDVIIKFAGHIFRLRGRILRLAIVGLSARDRRRVLRSLQRNGILSDLPVYFSDDPEDAKTWLVSEAG